jgi:hypothetical protein
LWQQLNIVPATKEAPPSRPAYFWWFLANILALCFAVTSWLACLHVFGNPEVPRNYEILRRLGRLPEIRRYTVLDAPNGTSLNPQGQYARFFSMTEEKRAVMNARLLRNYLTNFERPLALTYIEGEYQINAARLLDKNDFIKQGFVVRARALVRPDEYTKAAPYPVLIDYVFPTSRTEEMKGFRSGDLLDVKKSPNCAAIIHVDQVSDEDETFVCLTVVPIAYGPYQVGGDVAFEIAPPVEISPGASFPILGK